MPGKVNPSVPEMVNQVCFQVMGCDATVAIACEAGQLELNVMMPVIAWNALHASTILREAMKVFRLRCVDGITADEARARELLDRSTAAATALSPYIGYAATAEIAKESVKTGKSIRALVLERGLLDDAQLDADPVGGRDDARRASPGEKGGAGQGMARSGQDRSASRRPTCVIVASSSSRLPSMPGAIAVALRCRTSRATATAAKAASVRHAGSRAARSARSRAVAEAGSDHGRARHRRRIEVAELGAGRRLVHAAARRARRTQRTRLRRRHPARRCSRRSAGACRARTSPT